MAATIGNNPLISNPLARNKTANKEPIIAETTATVQLEQQTQSGSSQGTLNKQVSTTKEKNTSVNIPLEVLLEQLQQHGYVAKERQKYVKHTFDMKESAYKRFIQIYPALGKKVREAITEAIEDWCNKYQSHYDSIKKVTEHPK